MPGMGAQRTARGKSADEQSGTALSGAAGGGDGRGGISPVAPRVLRSCRSAASSGLATLRPALRQSADHQGARCRGQTKGCPLAHPPYRGTLGGPKVPSLATGANAPVWGILGAAVSPRARQPHRCRPGRLRGRGGCYQDVPWLRAAGLMGNQWRASCVIDNVGASRGKVL
jgi:hypothetical protein